MILLLIMYLKLQMAEFSWSYGRGRFFGHYGLLLFLSFWSFPGKCQNIFWAFIGLFCVFLGVVRVVSIFDHIWFNYDQNNQRFQSFD